MRKKILYTTQRAKKGEGRKALIKPIQVPQEVKEELDIFKSAYSEILGQKVTYEQILRRWMDHAGRIDADVKHRVEDIKETRRRHLEGVAEAAEENAMEIEQRAKANGTTLAEEAMKQRDGVIMKLRGSDAPETDHESVLPEPDTQEKIAKLNFAFEFPYHENIPKHSYKFVGPGGEYEACDGKWGIECSREDEDKSSYMSADEMFENGYKLVRDDGKEFFSINIEVTRKINGEKLMTRAWSLQDFDDL